MPPTQVLNQVKYVLFSDFSSLFTSLHWKIPLYSIFLHQNFTSYNKIYTFRHTLMKIFKNENLTILWHEPPPEFYLPEISPFLWSHLWRIYINISTLFTCLFVIIWSYVILVVKYICFKSHRLLHLGETTHCSEICQNTKISFISYNRFFLLY